MVFEVVHSDPFQVADLRSDFRDRDLLRQRYAVVVAARLHTNAPFSEIARALNRDHSSICRAMEAGLAMYRADEDFVEVCDRLATRCVRRGRWRGDIEGNRWPKRVRALGAPSPEI